MVNSIGLLSYDIPVAETAVYRKLRRRIRNIAVPLNASAYLIPWAARDTVNSILQEIKSEKPNVLDSGVYKFDDSEEKTLAAAAERNLTRLVQRAHKLVQEKLHEAELTHSEILNRISSVKSQSNRKTSDSELMKMEEAANSIFESSIKKALNKAEKTLKEARNLAVLFALSSQLEFAFESIDKSIQHQREVYTTKLEIKSE